MSEPTVDLDEVADSWESHAKVTGEVELIALIASWRERGEALEPFVALANARDANYRKRGGNPDTFPDSHPSYDIDADKRDLPMGAWLRARAALGSSSPTDRT